MGGSPSYTYPKRLPLVRFFWLSESIRKNPIPYHRQFFSEYGDTFSVKIGKKKYVLLSRDKEVVKHILQKNQKNYKKSKIQTDFLSKYLGNGLLTSQGECWRRQRRLIQPAFHKSKMVQIVKLIDRTVNKEVETMHEGQGIDPYPLMNTLTFKVVANSLFDVKIAPSTLERLQSIIEQIQAFLVKEIRLPHKRWWFKLIGETARHKQLAQESRDIIQSIIEQRKEEDVRREDLLDLLLDARYEDTGEPMEMEQLIDEISILFVAGHETTANALTFTLFLLAEHPEIQERVYEEVSGLDWDNSSSAHHLRALPFTRAVIDEAMRLYPPAWITDRENLEDDEVAGFSIRRDTLIGVSFYELHRNPDYWDDPERFEPKRFLDGLPAKSAEAYFPFGAGPRMCIGMGFAISEMLLVVTAIVLKFRLSSAGSTVQFNPLITLKPVDLKIDWTLR
ncbi:cytochrome P450 [Aureitalea marina]|uniref:Cytochrome P450 n=1 Tax=Aureitalea marina TaxID=930804 RepID=A0A2S7KRA4_9FLAO|nr:cytochrome P450 [Aureitalea marina]PQB05151.1 cytochrome P450 [Aureitalea marina]